MFLFLHHLGYNQANREEGMERRVKSRQDISLDKYMVLALGIQALGEFLQCYLSPLIHIPHLDMKVDCFLVWWVLFQSPYREEHRQPGNIKKLQSGTLNVIV